jgi:hypothetical protein
MGTYAVTSDSPPATAHTQYTDGLFLAERLTAQRTHRERQLASLRHREEAALPPRLPVVSIVIR